jgi:His-Xaa-Ser system protein HxsD
MSNEVKINPKIYPLEVIYSATYMLLDKAFIVIDGDPNKEIIIKIKPKNDNKQEDLVNELNNELINYSVYKTQSEKNKDIRQTLIQRALLTNGFEDDTIDDPEGIAIPWEEKYGKDKDK